MNWEWLALAFVFAAGNWYAVVREKARLRVFTKPAVILALLVGFTLAGGWSGQNYWFGLGLAFSLVGDVLLMLPPGAFMSGLAAFLVAHILYILGFSQGLTFPGWSFLYPIAILAAADFFIYRRLRRAVISRPRGRWMRFPMHLYQIIISLMVVTALMTLWRVDWPRTGAWLASLGALSFLVSDTILANNRFVNPIPGGRLLVIISYHVGQAALISGVLLRG